MSDKDWGVLKKYLKNIFYFVDVIVPPELKVILVTF